MYSFRDHWLAYVTGAALIAIGCLFSIQATAETIPTRVKPAADLPYVSNVGSGFFEIEVSGGAGLSNDELKSSGSKIDLSQTGLLGGIGVGYMIQRGDIFFGPMARFSLLRVNGDVGGATIKTDQLWEVALKVGRCWHTATDKCKVAFFGLVGWAQETLDLKSVGLDTKNPNGLMLGGGIEAHLTGAIYARLEVDHYSFSSQNAGGDKLTPDVTVARVSAAYKFWDRTAAAPLK